MSLDRPRATDELGEAAHPARPGARGADAAISRSLEPVVDEAYLRRQDMAAKMREMPLSAKIRELPFARDVMPGIDLAYADHRKFWAYSMDPNHRVNQGRQSRKVDGWRDLGYPVDDPTARQAAGKEVAKLICQELVLDGRAKKLPDSPDGLQRYQVHNGFLGPNGRPATLVTCWRIASQDGVRYPRLNTTYLRVHKETQ